MGWDEWQQMTTTWDSISKPKSLCKTEHSLQLVSCNSCSPTRSKQPFSCEPVTVPQMLSSFFCFCLYKGAVTYPSPHVITACFCFCQLWGTHLWCSFLMLLSKTLLSFTSPLWQQPQFIWSLWKHLSNKPIAKRYNSNSVSVSKQLLPFTVMWFVMHSSENAI